MQSRDYAAVEKLVASGMTAVEACKQAGIPVQAYYTYRSKNKLTTPRNTAPRRKAKAVRRRKTGLKAGYTAISVQDSTPAVQTVQNSVTVIVGSPDAVVRVLGGMRL